MAIPRLATLTIILGLFALMAAATPAAAANEPNAGCGGDPVEVCIPTCVTDPCPAYVCIHIQETHVCRTLWT